MYVTLVHVDVIPEHINDFIAACQDNHLASIRETGNRRFDILQSAEHPEKFVLYEAYASMAEAQAHKDTSHYLNWRTKVADWMASPRQGIVYQGLLPND